MKKLEKVLADATSMIYDARDDVTKHVRAVLLKSGFPHDIACKYSANFCGGGEWILANEEELCLEDIQLLSDEYIVKMVKEIENSNL